MAKRHNWLNFYEKTQKSPPSELLVKALKYVAFNDKAIDIGGGALKDSRFLLEKGFNVLDLDSQKLPRKLTKDLDRTRFQHVVSLYDKFDFPKGEYDLATAMFALPFNAPKTFKFVILNIRKSLKTGGIFCGNFFGNRDEWSVNPEMTFLTIDEARHLFEGMELIYFEEREWNGVLADGITIKHWHTFDFIVKKI